VDAPVVAALKTAGYVVAGTTNMHELAFGITSENADYGPVRLPGHPTRSAGGSSGGSSVAVAEGSGEIALGTDTGGSVSIPASHCGIYGLRPSTGRWPGAGVTGLSWTRDTAGVFARNLAQLQVVDAIITGQSAAKHSAERLRLGVPTQLLEALDPHTEQVVNLALEKLEQHAVLVEVDYAPILEQLTDAEQPVVLWESRRLLASVAAQTFDMAPQAGFEYLAKHVGSPDVASLLHAELADPVSPDSYASAQRSLMQTSSWRSTNLMHWSFLPRLRRHPCSVQKGWSNIWVSPRLSFRCIPATLHKAPCWARLCSHCRYRFRATNCRWASLFREPALRIG